MSLKPQTQHSFYGLSYFYFMPVCSAIRASWWIWHNYVKVFMLSLLGVLDQLKWGKDGSLFRIARKVFLLLSTVAQVMVKVGFVRSSFGINSTKKFVPI